MRYSLLFHVIGYSINILNQVNMSIDEFLFIHNNFTNADNLLSEYGRVANQRKERHKLLDTLNSKESNTLIEKEFLLILESADYIEDDKWDLAREKVAPIWQRLQNQDSFYYRDFIILNSILFLFPLETAYQLYEVSKKKFQRYNKFNQVPIHKINIEINLILMMIQDEKFQDALDHINQLIPDVLEQKNFAKLSTLYVRKGYIQELLNIDDEIDYMDRGFSLLNLIEQDERISLLTKEYERVQEKFSSSKRL